MRGMKKQACVLVLLLGVFCGYQPLFGADKTYSAKEVYHKLMANTVLIETPHSWGTGVIIGTLEGKSTGGFLTILTNHHVVANLDSPYSPRAFFHHVNVYFPVITGGTKENPFYLLDRKETLKNPKAKLTGKVWFTNPKRDLAYILVGRKGRTFSRASFLSKKWWGESGGIAPNPGEKVYSIGNPVSSIKGSLWVFSEGSVRSKGILEENDPIWGPSSISTIYTSTPINAGDSGGPVVNNKLQLVGLNASAVGNRIDFSTGKIIKHRLISHVISSTEEVFPFVRYVDKHSFGWINHNEVTLRTKRVFFGNAGFCGLVELILKNSKDYLNADLTKKLEFETRRTDLTRKYRAVRFRSKLKYPVYLAVKAYVSDIDGDGWSKGGYRMHLKPGEMKFLHAKSGRKFVAAGVVVQVIQTEDESGRVLRPYKITEHATRMLVPKRSGTERKRLLRFPVYEYVIGD